MHAVRQFLAEFAPQWSVAHCRPLIHQGACNRLYKLSLNGQSAVLRVPDPSEDSAPRRCAANANHQRASNAGLAPSIIAQNAQGWALIQWQDDTPPPTSPYIYWAHWLRRLHTKNLAFSGELNVGQLIQQTCPQQTPLISALQHAPSLSTGLHCDLNPGNLLFTKAASGQAIDWDYSCRGSIYWDLASFCISHKLTEQQTSIFLRCYFTHPVNRLEQQLFLSYRQLYQQVCDAWYKRHKK